MNRLIKPSDKTSILIAQNLPRETYAVIGNPIAHSRSPWLHQQFAKQIRKTIDYLTIESPLDSFHKTVHRFQQQGGKGLNITTPFKQEAVHLVGQCTERAKLAKAVNVITMKDNGELTGENTDGIGFIRDITRNHGIVLLGKRILLIGAGGAARGILGPILQECPAQLVITNRTINKAEKLVDEFQDLGNLNVEEKPIGEFDIIINATSFSLGNNLFVLPNAITPSTFFYDIRYTTTEYSASTTRGFPNKVVNGWGMLVEQAAEAFFLWHTIMPNTKSLLKISYH